MRSIERRTIFVIVSVVVGACCSYSQQRNGAYSSESTPLEAEVDHLFSQWDRPDSPGCSISIVHQDKIVLIKGYGSADLEQGVKNSSSIVFHVGSIAKQFTAMAVLLLVQQGRLSLDDDIRKYVPEMPDYGSPITIRNLIYHTSGIRDQWDLLVLAGWREGDVVTEDDILRLLVRQKKLNFRPGSDYAYSNSGYTLLSVIVRRVGRQPLSEFAEAQIFRPLGMNNTRFLENHTSVVPGRAAGYKETGPRAYRTSIPPYDVTGATNLLTTTEDLARWNQNFNTGVVGGAEGIQQMLTPGRLADGKSLPYAFGLELGAYRGLATVEHGGADYGYVADFIRFPAQQFAVACLCNGRMINPGYLAREVADLYLTGELHPSIEQAIVAGPTAFPGASARQAAGAYQDPNTLDVRNFVFAEGRLFYSEEDTRVEMIQTGARTFKMKGSPVSLEIRETRMGHATRLVLTPAGEPPRTYVRISPVAQGRIHVREYSGTYYASELDTTLSVIAAGNRLVLRRKKFVDTDLIPLSADSFTIRSIGRIRFTRNPHKSVTGFTLNTERSRGIMFLKRQSKDQ